MASSSVKSVYLSLRRYLVSRPDIGALRASLDLVLEPANPFDPKAARSPKRWLVFFSLLCALGFGCFVYFNFWQ